MYPGAAVPDELPWGGFQSWSKDGFVYLNRLRRISHLIRLDFPFFTPDLLH